jgi:serine/threonine protein kinase
MTTPDAPLQSPIRPLPSLAMARIVGRYALYEEFASGGMAAVHFGRLVGSAGFSRTVAIKRLHDPLARDPEFIAMMLDEARITSRIVHPNVVPITDIVADGKELLLVMEYVPGESLAKLLRAHGGPVPARIAAAIVAGVLHGLHAAHEATSDIGEALGVVHRDVSPQNILLGVDGVPRVVDFGIAKSAMRVQITRDGQVKGKLAYMAPEQIQDERVDRRTDVYAGAVVLWECLTGRRLFEADNDQALRKQVLDGIVPAPSSIAPHISRALDDVVLRGVMKKKNRFESARQMALALEDAVGLATASEVGAWVDQTAGATLRVRARSVADVEQRSASAQLEDPAAAAVTGVGDIVAESGTRAPSSSSASINVTRASVAPHLRPRSSWPRARLLLVLPFAVALGAWLLFTARRSVPSPPREPSIVVQAATLDSGAPALPATIAPTPPAVSESAAPRPRASAPSAPPRTPAVRAVSSPAAAATARAKAAAKNCENPFFTDEAGVRRVKRECFARSNP